MNIPKPARASYTRDRVPDPTWAARGACARHPDPDLWFASADEPRAQQAIDICGTCPVKAECLGYAMSVPGLPGIWGGTTTTMRTRLRKQARRRDTAA
jgi:WhiB family redox-sensing transcriptional regulator